MEAVGIPLPVTFVNAKRALFVDVLPRRRSSVALTGERAPRFLCQKLVKTFPPLLISPVQSRFPLLLVTVQPVEENPPARFTFPVVLLAEAILTSPVELSPILTCPVVPASIERLVAGVDTEIVGAVDVKVKAVGDVVILSREATPVNAPTVETF